MTSDVARSVKKMSNNSINISYSNLLNQLNESNVNSSGVKIAQEKFLGEIQGKNIASPNALSNIQLGNKSIADLKSD
jgi:hypothetical protein